MGLRVSSALPSRRGNHFRNNEGRSARLLILQSKFWSSQRLSPWGFGLKHRILGLVCLHFLSWTLPSTQTPSNLLPWSLRNHFPLHYLWSKLEPFAPARQTLPDQGSSELCSLGPRNTFWSCVAKSLLEAACFGFRDTAVVPTRSSPNEGFLCLPSNGAD